MIESEIDPHSQKRRTSLLTGTEVQEMSSRSFCYIVRLQFSSENLCGDQLLWQKGKSNNLLLPGINEHCWCDQIAIQ